MSNKMNNAQDLKNEKLFDTCLQTRNMEIELFWKRSTFFWGFIALSFAGYATLVEAKSNLSIIVACFGFFSSFSWILVNRGSKWWQQNWEEKLHDSEQEVIGETFSSPKVDRKEILFLGASKCSVSKITTLLSYYSTTLWSAIICYELLGDQVIVLSPMTIKLILVSITIVFILLAIIFTKGKDKKANQQVEPTPTTPVDSVNTNSGAAHP
jgi:hypothetical protein